MSRVYRIHTYVRTYVRETYLIVLLYITYRILLFPLLANSNYARTLIFLGNEHLPCGPSRRIRAISFPFVYRVVRNFIFYAEFAQGYSAYGRVLRVCSFFFSSFVPEKSAEFDDARRKGIWERGSKRSPTLIHIGETQTRGIHGASFTMA